MKKLIRITESDLKRIAKKVIKEESLNTDMLDMDYEMSGTRRRGEFTPTDKEKEIQGVFGAYSEDIPPAVIRYMRKNPEKILKRLSNIYPDLYMRYIPSEGPLDEATIEVEPEDFEKVKGKLGPNDTLRVRDLNEEDHNPFADVPMWKGKR